MKDREKVQNKCSLSRKRPLNILGRPLQWFRIKIFAGESQLNSGDESTAYTE